MVKGGISEISMGFGILPVAVSDNKSLKTDKVKQITGCMNGNKGWPM
jgi:hypothetical protein